VEFILSKAEGSHSSGLCFPIKHNAVLLYERTFLHNLKNQFFTNRFVQQTEQKIATWYDNGICSTK